MFGGDTLTATDIAVAGGPGRDRRRRRLVADLDPTLVRGGLARIADRTSPTRGPDAHLAPTRCRSWRSAAASVLLPDELPGLGDVHRPEHFAVANAIGAAIAQVGGEVDRVFAIDPGRRDAVLDEARQEAVDRAVAAGADPGTRRIVDFDEVPIAVPARQRHPIRSRPSATCELAERVLDA